MADLQLFDTSWLTGARHPDLAPALSADARRTQRQRRHLAAGYHPATGVRLLDSEWGYQCRDCDHAVRVDAGNRRYWKCLVSRLGASRSAASDIRISWPACALLRIDTPVEVRRG
jgi:hypothetical protein